MEKRWVLLTIIILIAGLIMILLWARQTDPGTIGPDTHTEKTAPQALNAAHTYLWSPAHNQRVSEAS
ncbi:hypothetical protein [Gluconobacter cerinus]|uniref:hypothetical protein n=1 Tax=Gluconobacter cerinus TaxID=38307 RepID=UPI001B8D5572|nr:hypothetical protein [Gluconobacter cerinus]MBS0983356.1 hypothetical protein [Gluconobacter cerinus]